MAKYPRLGIIGVIFILTLDQGLLKSAMPDIQTYVEYTNTVFKTEL